LETNGSLLTEEIAKFLNKNNVKILASMNGPQDIHDSMRVYIMENLLFKMYWHDMKLQNRMVVLLQFLQFIIQMSQKILIE
jgi:sulfatase maturation enzyme AslB (radical SAM superfamily)